METRKKLNIRYRYLLPTISTIFGIIGFIAFVYELQMGSFQIIWYFILLIYVAPAFTLMDYLTSKSSLIDSALLSLDPPIPLIIPIVFNTFIFFVIGLGIDWLIKWKRKSV